ncbi:MAG: cation-efflux pump, partial [Synechococcus sp.]
MGLAGQNSEREDRRSEVQRVLLVALGVNVGMSLLKLVIG